MTDKKIFDGNLLIAQFTKTFQLQKGITDMGLVRNEAKYHKSWDSLIPAWVQFKRQNRDIFGNLSKYNTMFLLGVCNNTIDKSWTALVRCLEQTKREWQIPSKP